MSEPNDSYQEHQTHNHVTITQAGHQVNGQHNGFDVALGLIGALLALVVIVALFVFGLVALPFVAVVAVAWLAKEALS